jgi:uncharacterized membrane protein YhaH (DUF805 family)
MKQLLEVLRAWNPIHAPRRMRRSHFWIIYLSLCAANVLCLQYLFTKTSNADISLLCAWTAIFLTVVSPAVVRRHRDAGLPVWLSILLLLLVYGVALAALFIPAIVRDETSDIAASAVYTITISYATAMIPVTVCSLLPSSERVVL